MGKSDQILITVYLPCQRLLFVCFLPMTASSKSIHRRRVVFGSLHDGQVSSLSKVYCTKIQISESAQ